VVAQVLNRWDRLERLRAVKGQAGGQCIKREPSTSTIWTGLWRLEHHHIEGLGTLGERWKKRWKGRREKREGRKG